MFQTHATQSEIAQDLIFWAGADLRAPELGPSIRGKDDDEDDIFLVPDSEAVVNVEDKGKGKDDTEYRSMYVTLCEEMIEVVLKDESFLFTEEEINFFRAFRALSYNARYLLMRVLLRKEGKWHRLDSFNKFVSEIGPLGSMDAIKELCRTLPVIPNFSPPTIKSPQDDVIDLTLDDDDDDEVSPAQSSLLNKYGSDTRTAIIVDDDSCPQVETQSNRDKDKDKDTPKLDFFAEDESCATSGELLQCLRVDELRELGKQMRLPRVDSKREDLIRAILARATSQPTLLSFLNANPNSRGSSKSRSVSCSSRSPASSSSNSPFNLAQADLRLRKMTSKMLKRCIRVNPAILTLFRRLHVVYFRSTEYPRSIMTKAILVRCRKRTYAPYEHKRTASIFPTREALLRYEEALKLRAVVDDALAGVETTFADTNKLCSDFLASTTSQKAHPANLISRRDSNKENIDETSNPSSQGYSRSQVIPLSQSSPEEKHYVFIQAQDQPRSEDTNAILKVFEHVYPRWKELVSSKGAEEAREMGLERFEEGYVLTKIICVGQEALGRRKMYYREVEILEELLSQRRWRRARRGRWYDRLALVLTHIALGRAIDAPEDEEENVDHKEVFLEKAMQVTIRGLDDPDTHIVSRPALEQRLFRLQSQLKIPEEDRRQVNGKLKTAEEITLSAIRAHHYEADDSNGQRKLPFKPVTPKREKTVQERIKIQEEAHKGKSVWLGREGEDVTVEERVLQHYQDLGFKGFHSEGRIVTTIFGLLFWDIIFSPVLGAFETPFQSAPLDIGEDSFYYARKHEMRQRLSEIEIGFAPELIEMHDEPNRGKEVLCVGVRWDLCSKSDLVEIVTCLGGKALKAVCSIFCEDYGHRGSGLPDLFVWNTKDRICKFIEVKGPGDSLQENQKVWIDVLLRAGIQVEVCHVEEEGISNVEEQPKKKGRGKNKRATTEPSEAPKSKKKRDNAAIQSFEREVGQ